MVGHQNIMLLFTILFLQFHEESILKSKKKDGKSRRMLCCSREAIRHICYVRHPCHQRQYWWKESTVDPRIRMETINWIVTESGDIDHPPTYQVKMKKSDPFLRWSKFTSWKNLIWWRRFRFHSNVFNSVSAHSYLILVSKSSQRFIDEKKLHLVRVHVWFTEFWSATT